MTGKGLIVLALRLAYFGVSVGGYILNVNVVDTTGTSHGYGLNENGYEGFDVDKKFNLMSEELKWALWQQFEQLSKRYPVIPCQHITRSHQR
jgi:hypothetical protein